MKIEIKKREWTAMERRTVAAYLAQKVRPDTQDDHNLLQGALSVLAQPAKFLNDNLDQIRELQDLREDHL